MLNLDHAVIVVADIDRATRDFRLLGFKVSPGGRHSAKRSANAVILFYDGSYIELLAFTPRVFGYGLRVLGTLGLVDTVFPQRSVVEKRFLRHGAAGEGLVDLALLSKNLRETMAVLETRDSRFHGPLVGGRTLPDGRELSWEFAVPDTDDLPFILSDLTDRSIRAPGGECCHHPNGVGGISAVNIAVKDLSMSRDRYSALAGVGLDPELSNTASATAQPGGNDEECYRSLDFRLGAVRLTLTESEDASTPIGRHLSAHGEGPFELELRTVNRNYVGELKRSLTHGARIRLTA